MNYQYFILLLYSSILKLGLAIEKHKQFVKI